MSGAHSQRWAACKGTKKSEASENSSPAQMYQPHVSSSGIIRRPFSGRRPSLTFFEIPTFRLTSQPKYGAPNREQTTRCLSCISAFIAKIRSIFPSLYRTLRTDRLGSPSMSGNAAGRHLPSSVQRHQQNRPESTAPLRDRCGRQVLNRRIPHLLFEVIRNVSSNLHPHLPHPLSTVDSGPCPASNARATRTEGRRVVACAPTTIGI